MKPLKLGLLVNPVAGIGGAVALKGSDGADLQAEARQRGGQYLAADRAGEFLDHLRNHLEAAANQLHWVTAAAPMGAQCLQERGWQHEVIVSPTAPTTAAADTQRAVHACLEESVDLLVFVGGDGTARDVLTAAGTQVPVLGVPAGVKMHSGVFAVSPRTAALLVAQLVQGGWVAPVLREVRDYDPASPSGEMHIQSFGELLVPEISGYLQQTKVGGKESEPLAVQDICAQIEELLPPDRDVVLGPGSTCLAIKQTLGLDGTLRGVDVKTQAGETLLDVTAAQLETIERPLLVVSFSRGQGFLFGRGNQQISAAFLRKLHWPDDVWVVGTRTKLNTLAQRPLLLDTGDASLDEHLSGLVAIISGYEDRLLYRLSATAS